MNEQLIRVTAELYNRDPASFTDGEVETLVKNASILGLPLKRKHEADDFNFRNTATQMFTGFVEGFTTLPVNEWMKIQPKNTVEKIAYSVGSLMGFVGVLPGPGLLGKIGLAKVLEGAGVHAAADFVKAAPSVFRFKSVPMFVADKAMGLIEKTGVKATLEASKFLKESPVIKDMVNGALHLGMASAAGAAPIYDITPQTLIDQRFSGFIHGGLYGAANAAIGNLFARGGKFDMTEHYLKKTSAEINELAKTNPDEAFKILQSGDRVNKIARAISSSIAFGLPSTLARQPLELQIYEYLINGYFGAKEMSWQQKEAMKIAAPLASTQFRSLLLDPENTIKDWKDLHPEVQNELKLTANFELGGMLNRFSKYSNSEVAMSKSVEDAMNILAEKEMKGELSPEQAKEFKIALSIQDRIAQKIKAMGKETDEKVLTATEEAVKEVVKEEQVKYDKHILNQSIMNFISESKGYIDHIGEDRTDVAEIISSHTDLNELYRSKGLNYWRQPFRTVAEEIAKDKDFQAGKDAIIFENNVQKTLLDIVSGVITSNVKNEPNYDVVSFQKKVAKELGYDVSKNPSVQRKLINMFTSAEQSVPRNEFIWDATKNELVDAKSIGDKIGVKYNTTFEPKAKLQDVYAGLTEVKSVFHDGKIIPIQEAFYDKKVDAVKMMETLFSKNIVIHGGNKQDSTLLSGERLLTDEQVKDFFNSGTNWQFTEFKKGKEKVRLYDEYVAGMKEWIAEGGNAKTFDALFAQDVEVFRRINFPHLDLIKDSKTILEEAAKGHFVISPAAMNKRNQLNNAREPRFKYETVRSVTPDAPAELKYLILNANNKDGQSQGNYDKDYVYKEVKNKEKEKIDISLNLPKSKTEEDLLFAKYNKSVADAKSKTATNRKKNSEGKPEAWDEQFTNLNEDIEQQIEDALSNNSLTDVAEDPFSDFAASINPDKVKMDTFDFGKKSEEKKNLSEDDIDYDSLGGFDNLDTFDPSALGGPSQQTTQPIDNTQSQTSVPRPTKIPANVIEYITRFFESQLDGGALWSQKTFDAAIKGRGYHPDSGSFKGTHYTFGDNQNLGAIMNKFAAHRADDVLNEWMEANDIHVLFFDTTAKQRGNRVSSDFTSDSRNIYVKDPVVYTTKWEDIGAIMDDYPQKMDKPQPYVVQYGNLIEDPNITGKFVEHTVKANIVGHETDNTNFDLYMQSKDEAQRKEMLDNIDLDFIGVDRVTDILKNHFDDPIATKLIKHILNSNEDMSTATEAYFGGVADDASMQWVEEYLKDESAANKILTSSKIDMAVLQLPGVKNYWQTALTKWVMQKAISPKTKYASKLVMRPHSPVLFNDTPIERGTYWLGGDLRQKTVLGPDGKEAKLGELWDKYEKKYKEIWKKDLKELTEEERKIYDLFEHQVLRVPADSRSGVRSLKLAGFKNEQRGMSIFLHPEDMTFLGGADTDIDTAYVYYDVPRDIKDYFRNNKDQWYNPDGTIIQSKAAGEVLEAPADKQTKLYMFSPLSKVKVNGFAYRGNQLLGYALSFANRLKTMVRNAQLKGDPIVAGFRSTTQYDMMTPEEFKKAVADEYVNRGLELITLPDGTKTFDPEPYNNVLKQTKKKLKDIVIDAKVPTWIGEIDFENIHVFERLVRDVINYAADAADGVELRDKEEIRRVLLNSVFKSLHRNVGDAKKIKWQATDGFEKVKKKDAATGKELERYAVDERDNEIYRQATTLDALIKNRDYGNINQYGKPSKFSFQQMSEILRKFGERHDFNSLPTASYQGVHLLSQYNFDGITNNWRASDAITDKFLKVVDKVFYASRDKDGKIINSTGAAKILEEALGRGIRVNGGTMGKVMQTWEKNHEYIRDKYGSEYFEAARNRTKDELYMRDLLDYNSALLVIDKYNRLVGYKDTDNLGFTEHAGLVNYDKKDAKAIRHFITSVRRSYDNIIKNGLNKSESGSALYLDEKGKVRFDTEKKHPIDITIIDAMVKELHSSASQIDPRILKYFELPKRDLYLAEQEYLEALYISSMTPKIETLDEATKDINKKIDDYRGYLTRTHKLSETATSESIISSIQEALAQLSGKRKTKAVEKKIAELTKDLNGFYDLLERNRYLRSMWYESSGTGSQFNKSFISPKTISQFTSQFSKIAKKTFIPIPDEKPYESKTMSELNENFSMGSEFVRDERTEAIKTVDNETYVMIDFWKRMNKIKEDVPHLTDPILQEINDLRATLTDILVKHPHLINNFEDSFANFMSWMNDAPKDSTMVTLPEFREFVKMLDEFDKAAMDPEGLKLKPIHRFMLPDSLTALHDKYDDAAKLHIQVPIWSAATNTHLSRFLSVPISHMTKAKAIATQSLRNIEESLSKEEDRLISSPVNTILKSIGNAEHKELLFEYAVALRELPRSFNNSDVERVDAFTQEEVTKSGEELYKMMVSIKNQYKIDFNLRRADEVMTALEDVIDGESDPKKKAEIQAKYDALDKKFKETPIYITAATSKIKGDNVYHFPMLKADDRYAVNNKEVLKEFKKSLRLSEGKMFIDKTVAPEDYMSNLEKVAPRTFNILRTFLKNFEHSEIKKAYDEISKRVDASGLRNTKFNLRPTSGKNKGNNVTYDFDGLVNLIREATTKEVREAWEDKVLGGFIDAAGNKITEFNAVLENKLGKYLASRNGSNVPEGMTDILDLEKWSKEYITTLSNNNKMNMMGINISDYIVFQNKIQTMKFTDPQKDPNGKYVKRSASDYTEMKDKVAFFQRLWNYKVIRDSVDAYGDTKLDKFNAPIREEYFPYRKTLTFEPYTPMHNSMYETYWMHRNMPEAKIVQAMQDDLATETDPDKLAMKQVMYNRKLHNDSDIAASLEDILSSFERTYDEDSGGGMVVTGRARNLMPRNDDLMIGGWTRKINDLADYGNSLLKHYWNTLMAVSLHHNAEQFRLNSHKTNIGPENAVQWHRFMLAQIRSIMGLPAVFPDGWVNDPNFKLKGNPYWMVTEQKYIDQAGWWDKFLGITPEMRKLHPVMIKKQIGEYKDILLKQFTKVETDLFMKYKDIENIREFARKNNSSADSLIRQKSTEFRKFMTDNKLTKDKVQEIIKKMNTFILELPPEMKTKQKMREVEPGKFEPEMRDAYRKVRETLVSNKLASLSNAEGKWTSIALLAHPKSGLLNILSSYHNTLVSTGFDYLKDAVTKKRLATIEPRWADPLELEKDFYSVGAMDSYYKNEALASGSFNTANAKRFFERVMDKLKSNPREKDFTLFEIAKQEGLSQDFVNKGAYFMKASERHGRMTALVAHYLKARESLNATGFGFKWDDPWLIQMANKGVTATQFLYHNAARPEFMRTSLGKIFGRFQMYTFNSLKFRSDIFKKAAAMGYKPGTEQYKRYERLMTLDLFMVAMAAALPFSLFGGAVPPPFNYLQNFAQFLFGDEEQRDKAFYGILPWPANIIQPITPPAARIVTSTLNMLLSGDVQNFMDNQMWSFFPFGRILNDTRKTLKAPEYATERFLGIPYTSFAKNLHIEAMNKEKQDIQDEPQERKEQYYR